MSAWPDSAFDISNTPRKRRFRVMIASYSAWGRSNTPSGKVHYLCVGRVWFQWWKETAALSPHGQPRTFFV